KSRCRPQASSSSLLEAGDEVERCLDVALETGVRALQGYLDRLHVEGNEGFGSYVMNDRIARKVSALAGSAIQLLYTGEPVTIRAIDDRPPEPGAFEARTANKATNTRYKR